MRKVRRVRCVSHAMRMCDVRDIVLATVRSYKRTNEMIMGDMCQWDALFELLTKEHITLTDEQWETLDKKDTGHVVLGANYVLHKGKYATEATATLLATGLHPKIIELVVSYFGKIHIYVDDLADYLYWCGTCYNNPVKYVQKRTLRILLHERRHSCQKAADVFAEYKNMNAANYMQVYNTLKCEQDANHWAEFQLDHCYDL